MQRGRDTLPGDFAIASGMRLRRPALLQPEKSGYRSHQKEDGGEGPYPADTLEIRGAGLAQRHQCEAGSEKPAHIAQSPAEA